MTGFDVAIIAVLTLSMLVGLYRGFVHEFLSLAILALALVVALKFSRLPETWFPDIEISGFLLAGSELQLAAVFSLLFLSVLTAGRFIKKPVSARMRQSFMNLADRLLGAVFGMLRGGVIVLALVLLSGLTTLPFSDRWNGAMLVPLFERWAQHTMCHVPEGYQSPHYACVPL